MTNKRIFIAGHKGMVGSAITNKLKEYKNIELLTADRIDLDLNDYLKVKKFLIDIKPDEIYIAAAKVGGIHANNTYPAEFIVQNINIQNNIITASHESDVQKLLFLGSSCIYPKNATQPMKEDALMSGKLESTNEPYAIAKITGIKMCESYNRQYGRDYRSVMPTNLYGPNDNFHPKNSHVIPAMMKRFHDAVEMKDDEVTVWGTGKPMREFLHVDDMASACIHIMNIDQEELYKIITNEMCSHINIGTGVDVTISELSSIMAKTVKFKGNINFDNTKPDGTFRKVLDVSLAKKLGWKYQINLEKGLLDTYAWYLENKNALRS
jgi:GDP-L-fucose synthase